PISTATITRNPTKGRTSGYSIRAAINTKASQSTKRAAANMMLSSINSPECDEGLVGPEPPDVLEQGVDGAVRLLEVTVLPHDRAHPAAAGPAAAPWRL